MFNGEAAWKRAFCNELKALMTRYDATLSVQDDKLHVHIDERDDGSLASHPELDFNLGTAVLPAREDGSDE